MNLYPLSLCLWPDPYVHADYISNLLLSSFFSQTNVAGCMLLLFDCVGIYVWCGCNKKAKIIVLTNQKKKKKLCKQEDQWNPWISQVPPKENLK